jgi:UDP-N-acetylglucosamine 4-epimerase
MREPALYHSVNVTGTFNVFCAAKEAKVERVVFASSSSVYGDDVSSSKREDRLGRVLSPYAGSKRCNEIQAQVFAQAFAMDVVGLRYFNVFGPRQDPHGAYAAVIPRWLMGLLGGDPCQLFGSGDKSRDFCFVENVVQANILAATAPSDRVRGEIFNVAYGERTTLAELFTILREGVASELSSAEGRTLEQGEERPGDIPHSLAEIERAQDRLGYRATHDVRRGLEKTVDWYARLFREYPELFSRSEAAEHALVSREGRPSPGGRDRGEPPPAAIQ